MQSLFTGCQEHRVELTIGIGAVRERPVGRDGVAEGKGLFTGAIGQEGQEARGQFREQTPQAGQQVSQTLTVSRPISISSLAFSPRSPLTNAAPTRGRRRARRSGDEWLGKLATADQDELRFVVAADEVELAGTPHMGGHRGRRRGLPRRSLRARSYLLRCAPGDGTHFGDQAVGQGGMGGHPVDAHRRQARKEVDGAEPASGLRADHVPRWGVCRGLCLAPLQHCAALGDPRGP